MKRWQFCSLLASDFFLNSYLSRHDMRKHLIISVNNNFGLKSQANRKRLWISLVKQNFSSSSGSFHPTVKEHCRFKASFFLCVKISVFLCKYETFTAHSYWFLRIINIVYILHKMQLMAEWIKYALKSLLQFQILK